jgi:hypothetical protein
MINGQPNHKKMKSKKERSEGYNLGRIVAKLDQKQKDIDQSLQLSMIAKTQLSDLAIATKAQLVEMETMLKAVGMGGGMGQPAPAPEQQMMPAAPPMGEQMAPTGLPPMM